jgi:integrase
MTVRRLADDYLEKYAKPRKRSWQEDKRILERDVIPAWGARKASKITRRDVIDLLDEIVGRGAPVQANRTLAVVRRMFNFAIDRDVIAATPCHRLKPPSPETHKDRYLTLDEIRRFWNGLETAALARRTKLAFRLLLLTLQRSSEVIGINTSELDIRSRTWIIPAARTKNKRAHLVPLSPLAAEIIAELLEEAGEDGFLFPAEGSGDHLTRAALSRAITRNLEHFGVAKFTPHDLRRTGSTQLAAFKVPRFDRDRILNHTDRTVGAVYDIYEYQDEKRAALNLWSDVVTHCAASKGTVDGRKLQRALKYPAYFSGWPGLGVLEPGLHVPNAVADAPLGYLLRLWKLACQSLSVQRGPAERGHPQHGLLAHKGVEFPHQRGAHIIDQFRHSLLHYPRFRSSPSPYSS